MSTALPGRQRKIPPSILSNDSSLAIDYELADAHSRLGKRLMAAAQPQTNLGGVGLLRTLGLWDLILYGIVIIQPVAPMPSFGVVSNAGHGHVVTAILIAMVAMLFTAISYGRMARIYPSAGSAFTYVGRELHPTLGYVTGWSMAMDYILNPLICTIWCSKAAQNFFPHVPYFAWAIFFALLFTWLNLRGIETSARINAILAFGMGIVIVIFVFEAVRYIFHIPHFGPGFFTHPFYDPRTFSSSAVFRGTSIAVLTYIGFDGISTLSEEAKNPRRNVLLATVLVCVITGVLATIEVYLAQLIWPASQPFPEVDTAFVHISGRVGGVFLFGLVNLTLLVANIGSGMSSHLGAARLLYGMGRSNALPRKFFGAIEPRNRVPRNNVVLVGAIALLGAFLMSYELGAEMLNFGALIAFMGVNASAFVRFFLREEKKRPSNLFPPVLGFFICLFIWLHLGRPAMIVGGIWMLVGIVYGAIKTRGFRGDLVQFSFPADET
ncbi:MAG TPA: APC family permease [Candidatus Acidoferrales bacterium]|nr:APC family permease [Candidatus Acidoferrales bacterium]